MDLTDDREEALDELTALVDADPPPALRSSVARRGLGALTLFIIGFVLYMLVLSGLPHARAQRALSERFRAELAEATAPVNEAEDFGAEAAGPPAVRPGDPIAVISIPSLGLDQTMIEGSTSTDLMRGPGHLPGSALPGQPGTSIVLGRCCTFGRPFSRIGALERGDRIEVVTGQGRVAYRVAGVRYYDSADPRAFADAGNALVLVTSDGVTAGSRVVVRARPEGALQTAGSQRPHDPPSPSELGMSGDASAGASALIAAEILAVVGLLTVALGRRWSRWPTWLVCVPTLMAALWFVYEQLARLLPGAV